MKYLLLADIHIDNYPDYNYSRLFRLNQFIKLAEEIVELGKQYGCEKLILAGDTLNRPTNRPKVNHTLGRFANTVSTGFKEILFILGQHDTDTKSNIIDYEDTMMTTLTQYGFKYMDHQVIKSGNITIAFQNWTPEQDTSWIETPVDYLIGHYTKSNLFGQDIDESKFKTMIHGDIHNDQVIGKFVSIGNPIQHDMSSQAQGTGIILDDETGEWTRIKIDPNHEKFLRIYYTSDKDKGGFDGPLTYNIYKPVTVTNSEGLKVEIPEWEDISQLMDNIIHLNNLDDIHSEVQSKCVPYSETDFNFNLKYFRVKGFRSLTNFEIEFGDHDRIVLLGKNGSGKSSVIKALLNTFINNRFINNEKSFFTDSIELELGLFYQNKLYEIRRGNNWGMKIDLVEQNYNNKTEFSEDVINQLPFLKYADLFFITSNVVNLSSQFTPDRRVELISKFFRLDRVDAYAVTVRNIIDELNKELGQVSQDLTSQKGIQSFVCDKLSQYREKGVDKYNKKELEDELSSYVQLKNNNQAYKDYIEKLNRVKYQLGQKNSLKESLSKYIIPEIEQVKSRREELGKQVKSVNDKKSELNTQWRKYNELSTLIQQQLKSANDLKKTIDSLSQKGECPTCGSLVSKDKSSELISKYQVQLDEIKKSYMKSYTEITPLTHMKGGQVHKLYYSDTIKKLDEAVEPLRIEFDDLGTKINLYEGALPQYESTCSEITKLESDIKTFEAAPVKEVTLPDNLPLLEKECNDKLYEYKMYTDSLNDLLEADKKVEELEKRKEDLTSRIVRYSSYNQLMSRNGKVYEEILKKLAVSFSEEDITYEVNSGVFRNNPFVHFNALYRVRNRMVPYEALSDGQTTVCDLDFLSKLFSVRSGLLALDEHLRFLDDDNSPKAQKILSRMNVNTLLISTHDPNYTDYTRRLMLELSPQGETIIQNDN